MSKNRNTRNGYKSSVLRLRHIQVAAYCMKLIEWDMVQSRVNTRYDVTKMLTLLSRRNHSSASKAYLTISVKVFGNKWIISSSFYWFHRNNDDITIIMQGTRFTNDFWPEIQSKWNLCLALFPLLAIRSQQFCPRHDSTAVVPYTEFCSDHYVRIEVKVKRNFHRIRTAMEKNASEMGPCTHLVCIDLFIATATVQRMWRRDCHTSAIFNLDVSITKFRDFFCGLRNMSKGTSEMKDETNMKQLKTKPEWALNISNWHKPRL